MVITIITITIAIVIIHIIATIVIINITASIINNNMIRYYCCYYYCYYYYYYYYYYFEAAGTGLEPGRVGVRHVAGDASLWITYKEWGCIWMGPRLQMNSFQTTLTLLRVGIKQAIAT